MKEKTSIEFTKDEIEVIYHALTQEMNQSLRSGMSSCIISFDTLEHWYLLLKKIKKALKQYEQKTIQKKIQ